MKKSLVVKILSTFSIQEIKDFYLFIKSPYINTNKRLIKLVEILKENFPEFDSENIDEKKIYRKVFNSSSFNKQILKNLTSDLYSTLKQYISIKQLRNKKFSRNQIILIDTLFRKEFNNLFQKQFKLTETEFNRDYYFIRDVFYDFYKLFSINEKFILSNQDNINELLSNHNKKTISFLYFFTSQLIAQNINYLIKTGTKKLPDKFCIINSLAENFPFEKIINYIKNFDKRCYFSLMISYYIYLSFKEQNELRHLSEALRIFRKNYSYFKNDKIYVYEITESLINCVIRKLKHDNRRVLAFLFKLFTFYLEKGLYKHSGYKYLGNLRIRNILYVALALKKYSWIEKFALDYSRNFDPNHSESLLNYIRAMNSFEKGNYKESLDALNKVTTLSLPMKLDMKNLLLKVYYELNYFDAAFYLINSYRKLLKREKMLTKMETALLEKFINVVYRLLKIKVDNNSKIELDIIRKNIPESPKFSIHLESWVMDKIEELENNSITKSA